MLIVTTIAVGDKCAVAANPEESFARLGTRHGDTGGAVTGRAGTAVVDIDACAGRTCLADVRATDLAAGTIGVAAAVAVCEERNIEVRRGAANAAVDERPNSQTGPLAEAAVDALDNRARIAIVAMCGLAAFDTAVRAWITEGEIAAKNVKTGLVLATDFAEVEGIAHGEKFAIGVKAELIGAAFALAEMRPIAAKSRESWPRSAGCDDDTCVGRLIARSTRPAAVVGRASARGIGLAVERAAG
jgi:hypothetical protein